MTEPSDAPDEPPEPPSGVDPAGLRRVFLLAAVPFVGIALFAAGAVLGLRAFSHNHSLSCDSGFGGLGSSPYVAGCSHYSYAVPVTLGILGVVLVMAGGAFASYYAARNVGLPLVDALMRRRR